MLTCLVELLLVLLGRVHERPEACRPILSGCCYSCSSVVSSDGLKRADLSSRASSPRTARSYPRTSWGVPACFVGLLLLVQLGRVHEPPEACRSIGSGCCPSFSAAVSADHLNRADLSCRASFASSARSCLRTVWSGPTCLVGLLLRFQLGRVHEPPGACQPILSGCCLSISLVVSSDHLKRADLSSRASSPRTARSYPLTSWTVLTCLVGFFLVVQLGLVHQLPGACRPILSGSSAVSADRPNRADLFYRASFSRSAWSCARAA